MLGKFKGPKSFTKALIIVRGVTTVVATGLIITMLTIGDSSNPIG